MSEESTLGEESQVEQTARPSAFRLKEGKQVDPRLPKDLAGAAETGPLKELSEDEAAVRGFTFYVDAIRSGRIGSEIELEARLRAQTRDTTPDQTRTFLLSEDGNLIRDPNDISRRIAIPQREVMKIAEPDQRALLIGLYQEVNTTNEQQEAASKESQGLSLYTKKILSGEIQSKVELEARLNARVRNASFEEGRATLLTGEGRVFLSDDNRREITVPQTEVIKVVDPDQRALLTGLYQEVQTVNEQQKAANRELKGLSFYTKKILSGEIPNMLELEARLNGRVTRFGSDAFLLTADGYSLLDDDNDRIRIPITEVIRVADSDQRELLTQLYNLNNNSAIPETTKTLLGAYLQSGEAQALIRLKAILTENPDNLSESIGSFVDTFESQRRQAVLKQQFYTALADDDSIDPARALIEGFEEKSITDRALVSELGERFLAIRRARVTREFSQVLAEGDINQALATLTGLTRPQTVEDIQYARVLTEAAYRIELAKERESVLSMITAGLDTDPQAIFDFIDSLPKRPSVGDLDYLQEVVDLKERTRDFLVGTEKIKRLKIGNEIREEFAEGEVSQVLAQIDELPGETVEDLAFKAQILGLYKTYIAANRPADFDAEFADSIFAKLQERLQERFIRPELGSNREAAEYLADNFRRFIMPLVESFRDDPRTRKEMNKVLRATRPNGENDPQVQAQIDMILQEITEGNTSSSGEGAQPQNLMDRILSRLRENGVRINSDNDPEIQGRMDKVLSLLQEGDRKIAEGFSEERKSKLIQDVQRSEKAKALRAAQISEPELTELPEDEARAIEERISTFEAAKVIADEEAGRSDARAETLEEAQLLSQRDKAFTLLRLVRGGTINPRAAFIQRVADLEKQRPLTDTERAYFRSVQFLSLLNPQLVAVALADQGVTTEFLRHHFDSLAHKTTESLQDGMYIPAVLNGTGPQGLTAIGEIVRNNPELAGQLLVVDSGDEPGGPFAIPRGPAWELNSANRRGRAGAILPNAPDENELKTVRGSGSPNRWYPGERREGEDIRQGSINTTVDYLPVPDNLSNKRYPTNEEEALILGLQGAMTLKKVAFNTELLSVEPNPNKTEKGNKIATLKITGLDGRERIVRVKTDAILDAAGLGEGGYGFELEGSRAEQVLEQTKETPGFPKISKTLEFFKAVADRKDETKTDPEKSPGRTLVISGSGNSTDTLIENIAGLFQSNNPLVRDITKIYVVSEGDLSNRPRYAAISDVRARNGRGNLIEFVKARVNDVDFATTEGDPDDRELVFYNTDNELITDNEGNPIQGDAFVAATGFRPRLDKVYSSYLDGKSFRDTGEDAPVKGLTLPTNPDVAVADFLEADPSIVFLGTASMPRFTLEKFAQLPVEAREALLRNGAENAVAIGFRAPDTQAGVNIWLNSREVELEEQIEEQLPTISVEGEILPDTRIEFEGTVNRNRLEIADNINDEDLLLSPLLAYNLSSRVESFSKFSGEVEFELTYDQKENKFAIVYKKDEETDEDEDQLAISEDFMNAVSSAMSDEYFQSYALSLLGKRRRRPKLSAVISFQRGKVNAKNTFVQAA